jgi:PAS domain S-box-containing protein
MLLLPPIFPQVSFVDVSTGPLPLIVAESALIVLAIHNQTQLEVDRRAELADREEQYRSLLETTFEGIVISEREGGAFIEVNPGAAKMFGYTPPEVTGMSLIDFIAEDSREQLAYAVDAGAQQPLETLGLRKDGTEFHIEMVTQALTYREQPVRVVAVRDITERKEAAEVLLQQKRELEFLNQVGRALGSTLDLNQVITTILEEVYRLLSVTAASVWLKDTDTDELVCWQAVGPQNEIVRGWRIAPGEGFVGRVAATGESMIVPDTQATEHHFKEVDQLTKIEQRSILSVPMQFREQVIGVLQVLDAKPDRFQPTDLRLVESLAVSAAMAIENARLYEEIHRRAIQQAALNTVIAAAVAAADLQELLDIALDQTLRAFDLDIGAIWVGNHQSARGLPQETKQDILEAFRTVAVDIPDTVAVEDTQRGSAIQDSTSLGIHSALTVPIMAGGQPIGRLSLGDRAPRRWSVEEVGLGEAVGRQLGAVVERLRLLKQVQEQAQQMQQIVGTVSAGMLLLDSDMRVLLANPAAREHIAALCGAEEIVTLTHLGKHRIEELLISPTERPWHEIEIKEPVYRIFTVSAHAIGPEPETEGWVLVLRDVTQEREIEERVQRQERLAVVGQLAAGIAHDFNNIMSVIILYTRMLSQNRGLSPHDRKRFTSILEQADQATNLIEQILDFSRTSAIEPNLLDLNPFLRELIKLLERTLPENITLEPVFGPDEYTVNADPTRIQQAVMNLVVNARDAMPEGGELRIGLDQIWVGFGELPPVPEMKSGEWVQVTVSDTGTGIPPDVLPHIFDPFFTTKAPEQGTGLGLAQVHGIVEQHGGHIHVKSQMGHGTTFALYLPALQTPAVEPLKLETEPLERGHGETILVVEDKQATREAVASTLQSLGYRVLVAADGQKALPIFEQHGHEITLVLSDLVMPGISGTELFRALKQQDQDVKIVAMTGYPLQEENQDLSRENVVGWLRKPLSVEQLARAIKRALEA